MARQHGVVGHIVEFLEASGIHQIFGVDGANNEFLYDATYFRADMTVVLAKHELSAATMGGRYSRGGSRLGVVAATSCGGSLNLFPGLGSRWAGRVPVLALVGQPPTTLGDGSLNAEALFSKVSPRACALTPADLFAGGW
jgi:acetolactate synthase I/II/III large subunit